MRRTAAVLLFLLTLASCATAPPAPRVTLVTSDLDRFWTAFDAGATAADFERDYFAPASPGLKAFIEQRIQSAEQLAAMVASHRAYYSALRAQTPLIRSFEREIGASFAELVRLYPAAKLPPVFFVYGRLRSGGISTADGLVVGTELFGKAEGVPLHELDARERGVLKPIGVIPGIVAHELIHFQQKPLAGDSLLAKALREGSADFIGELISGKNINEQVNAYGLAHEAELWRDFSARMDQSDITGWIYSGDEAKGRPADLGYFIGYRISQAYYRRATDKRAAVREILEVEDARAFLAKSGYAGQ